HARRSEELDGQDPLRHGGPLVHEAKGGIAPRLEAEIDPAAPRALHEVDEPGGEPLHAGETGPAHGRPAPDHPPAKGREVVRVEGEAVVRDPEAGIPERPDLLDLPEDPLQRGLPEAVAPDGLRTEVARERAAPRDHDAGLPQPGGLLHRLAVPAVVESRT